MKLMIRGMLLFSTLVLTACAIIQPSMSEEFDRSVKAYNKMLRWHEIENAGATYIDEELQEDFVKQAGTLKKRGLSVTDFRILSSKLLPEKKSGDVITEFDYYILPSNKIKTISYRQNWVYLEKAKTWKLKTGLPFFE